MRGSRVLVPAVVLGGLLLCAGAAEADMQTRTEDHSRDAQLMAAGFVAAIVVILGLIRRKIWIAQAQIEDKAAPAGAVAGGTVAGAGAGSILVYHRDAIVPTAVASRHPDSVRAQNVSLLRYLVVGKDHRTSTSKTVAFAWTLAIVYGLVALLAARILGDSTGWDVLVYGGLQEEYLIFLGGPYAAAIIAKYKQVATAGASTSTAAEPGSASRSQLIADDKGEADLADFQYVVFNLVALLYFLGDLIPHLRLGFPDMPPVLAGLALTSAAGYSAKKLIAQERPRLVSIFPKTAPVAGAGQPSVITLYGRHLVVPGSVTTDAKPQLPSVSIGPKGAKVEAAEESLGTERLTIGLPEGLEPGEHLVRVVRADGTAAVTEAGLDALGLTLTARPTAPVGAA